jgi:adenosylmethionine-8-amino-7-oxononanoate aminotransferase
MGSTDHSFDAIANFGADFIPDIIVSAQGSGLTISNGKKIIDWTSGQVSHKQSQEISPSIN